jgi:hypothetical protein
LQTKPLKKIYNMKTLWLVIACCLLSGALATDEAFVELSSQTLYFMRDGNLIMVTPVTTGSSEHPTPEGEFKILGKYPKWVSKQYHSSMLNAQMIHEGRGIFLHHGFVFGPNKKEEEGSGACIRLNFFASKVLYELTKKGCRVRIGKSLPADLNWIPKALSKTRGYFAGKTHLFFDRKPPEGLEGASNALANFIGDRGSAKAVLNPQAPDEIAISDDIVALIMGKAGVTVLSKGFPEVDDRVKTLVSLPENRKTAMVHLVKPGRGNVEGSLWFFDCGSRSVTVTMEDINSHLELRGYRPMTEGMFKEKK